MAPLSGMLVARGQAVSGGGGGAYQLWRGVLPVLALQVELDELEASVLATVMPDLPARIERAVRPLAELDAQAARLRGLRARHELLRSVRTAARCPVRFEQAHAHYWLARIAQLAAHDPASREDAEAHLRAALDLFEQLGASWDAGLVRSARRTRARC